MQASAPGLGIHSTPGTLPTAPLSRRKLQGPGATEARSHAAHSPAPEKLGAQTSARISCGSHSERGDQAGRVCCFIKRGLSARHSIHWISVCPQKSPRKDVWCKPISWMRTPRLREVGDLSWSHSCQKPEQRTVALT